MNWKPEVDEIVRRKEMAERMGEPMRWSGISGPAS